MFFMSMDEFLRQLADSTDDLENPIDYEQLESTTLDFTPSAIKLNEDLLVDGVEYDRDGDGVIDMVQYDFNHDGVVDAVGIDTTGDGIIDTFYYDFDQDGIADAMAFDSTGEGSIDTISFGEGGLKIFSDTGFSISSAWEAGIARIGTVGVDTDGVLSDQAEQLGLDSEEHKWAIKAVNQEEQTPEMVRKELSFGSTTTCIGGSRVCLGCAGILIDGKIGCQTGACSGGKRVP